MIIIKVLFYLFAIMFAFSSMFKFQETKKYLQLLKGIKENDENYKNKSYLFSGYIIINFFWLLCGLFTYNYEYIMIGHTTSAILTKLFYNKSANPTIGNIIYIKITNFIWLFFYIFLIINTFHLHIQLDLLETIKNLF